MIFDVSKLIESKEKIESTYSNVTASILKQALPNAIQDAGFVHLHHQAHLFLQPVVTTLKVCPLIPQDPMEEGTWPLLNWGRRESHRRKIRHSFS